MTRWHSTKLARTKFLPLPLACNAMQWHWLRGARMARGMADGMDAGLDLGLEYLKALSGPNKSLLTLLTHSLLLVHKVVAQQ